MHHATVPIALDETLLDAPSRKVLAAFNLHPARSLAHMEMEPCAHGAWSLVVRIPSPTNDPRRHVEICLVEDRCPTLGFGAWHTHAELWDKQPVAALGKLLDCLTAILAGSILLREGPTVGDGLPYHVIDVRDPDEVLDDATSPDAPARSKLLSWSGEQDCMLDDLAHRRS